MKQSSFLLTIIAAALVLSGQPLWSGDDSGRAEAAQTTTKKSTTKKPAKKPAQKKSYCGYPAPPIPAGMSDFVRGSTISIAGAGSVVISSGADLLTMSGQISCCSRLVKYEFLPGITGSP